MSIEVDIYLREPSEVGSGELLGRLLLERLPLLNETFETSALGEAAPSFPVKVGSIRHDAPQGRVTLIPA